MKSDARYQARGTSSPSLSLSQVEKSQTGSNRGLAEPEEGDCALFVWEV